MKRATALQVLAAMLVIAMVASAFPLAQILLHSPSSSSPGSDPSSTPGAANAGVGGPHGADASGNGPGAPDLQGSLGGPSSRPAGSQVVGSTGSTLLDQVLNTAKLMGVKASLPDLPVDKLAPVNPLHPALLSWIAATHSYVPPHDLETQLARADAMPQPLQRDLALLVLSAVEATQLQQQALAKLTPQQLAWIRANPQLATQLVRGESTPETRALAALAGLVDTSKSVEASLLLLEAVEATRGSLQSDAGKEQLAQLASASVDPKTQEVLALLATASSKTTDEQKVSFAAQLVATTAGVPVPAAVAKPSFPDAVTALLDATGQLPDAAAVKTTLDTVSLFPKDLQGAIAETLAAEANAVNAANPTKTGGDSQAEALVKVLVATADALPTLEKYHLYWRDAPTALRVGQWDAAARAGWAVEHAALLESTRGVPTDVTRALGLMHGAQLVSPTVPERSFVDAYVALEEQKGYAVNDSTRAIVARAGAQLDPAVEKAAAHMMSGAAEAARLNKEALASLTPAEHALMLSNVDTSALYAKADITPAEIATLQQLSVIQEKIDVNKLVQAEVVGVRATMEAKDMLSPAFKAQADAARPYTFWTFLQGLLPWQTARAQTPGCTPIDDQGVVEHAFGGNSAFPIVSNDCDHDILLRLGDDLFTGLLNSGFTSCIYVCLYGGEVDHEALVITGTASAVVPPASAVRVTGVRCGPFQGPPNTNGEGSVCPSGQGIVGYTYATVPAVGAATVLLDLGGSHTYTRQVALTTGFDAVPVSLDLDLGGADAYLDPTTQYDDHNPLYDACDPSLPPNAHQDCATFGFSPVPSIGRSYGMPSQGSALAGGVAVLVHVRDAASYHARSLSQGYGQWGLGALIDLDPTARTTYSGREWVQGASGREMNLGTGLLLDVGGDDSYRASSGQGYGYGGLLMDLGGQDSYTNDAKPAGTPMVHLSAVPGADQLALDQRGDNKVWLDGPASLNVGMGIDMAVVDGALAQPQANGYTPFENFVFGTNGNDPQDCIDPTRCAKGPLDREQLIAKDSDGDGYPDFIERALSTDPSNPASYPVGFPTGPTFTLPTGIQVTPGDLAKGQPVPHGQDKIVDLRLPLQDAGTIDYACVGPAAINSTGYEAPIGEVGRNIGYTSYPNGFFGGMGQAPQGPCVLASYSTTSPGNGDASIPLVSQHGTNNNDPQNGGTEFSNVTFHLPAGILAIGDTVATSYDADYFFVLDLGGDDTFRNHAGGGLPVLLRNGTGGSTYDTTSGSSGASNFKEVRNQSFLAPSLVLNVDLGTAGNITAAGLDTGSSVQSQNGSMGDDRYLPPANDSGDFSQGSMWGVLVDTSGNDQYVAGSGSQGALGGVLLDLAGNDTFRALNLSQGAGITSSYDPGTQGTTSSLAGTDVGSTSSRSSSAGAPTALSGFLLHFGQGSDSYVAGSNSQGVARGFPNQKNVTSYGILLDDGGNDKFDTATLHGTASQGAGTVGGVGILVDLAGDDSYRAGSSTSQGAPISQSYGSGGSNGDNPGAGILVDGAGNDTYTYVDRDGLHDRTAQRQNNLTITRSELRSSAGHAYAQLGIHLDTDTNDPNVLVDSIMGTGGKHATSAQSDPTNTNSFYVDLPTAHLAIGQADGVDYDSQYAFVVSLGRNNHYHMNAGGFVPDVLLQATQPDPNQSGTEVSNPLPTSKPYGAVLSSYPVTFVLDGGNSTYVANDTVVPGAGALAQGMGYFGVGLLVSLGGHNDFTVLPEPLPALGSTWMARSPTLDGTIGKTEWAGVAPLDTKLVDLNDSRFTEPLQLRVSNDDKTIYFAISGHRAISDGSSDNLTIDLLADPSLQARANGQVRGDTWDRVRDVTLLDESRIILQPNACTVDAASGGDYHANAPNHDSSSTTDPTISKDLRDDTHFGCSLLPDGTFTIEMSKPLRAAFPADPGDLDVPFGAHGFDPSELHVRIALADGTDHETYAWPPNTANVDGAQGYPLNGNLYAETADWAALGLASLGQSGAAPPATRVPAFAQGAGIAGVGILAALGDTSADAATYTASDDAQGYGAYGGMGLLLDAGAGSDVYSANTFAQGASIAHGLGVLLELNGNDDYSNHGASLGYAAAGDTAALFADLGGFDAYHTSVPGAGDPNTRNATVAPQSGGSTDHRGAQTYTTIIGDTQVWHSGPEIAPGVSSGMGIDTLSRDLLSGGELDQVAKATTTLSFRHPGSSGDCQTLGDAFPTLSGTTYAQLTGLVCLTATASVSSTQTKVDGVDFLVSDGNGVWTRLGTSHLLSDGQQPTPTNPFVLAVNFSAFQDGVKTVFAQTAVAVNGTSIGAPILMRTQPSLGADTLRVIVDNPAHVATCTLPKLDVPADAASDPCAANTTPAVFSPNAINGTQALSVLWATSHDAQEEQSAIGQGWTIPVGADPVHFANVPCPDATVGTCNVIPLWLTQTGDPSCGASSTVPKTWGTEQPGYISHVQTMCAQYQDDNPYSHATGTLTAPLSIVKQDGFHVRLYNRSPFLITNVSPPQFTTRVIVTLLSGDGTKTIKDVNNRDIILADQNFTAADIPTSPTSVPGVPTDTVFNAVCAAACSTTDSVSNTLRAIIGGAVPDDLLSGVCPTENVANACDTLNGHVTVGSDRPCDDGTLDPTKAPCYQSGSDAHDLLNSEWATPDGTLKGADVGSEVRSLTSTATRVLNWSDMYVTLKDPATPKCATGESCPALTSANGVVTIPKGYSFKVEIWTSNDNGAVSGIVGQTNRLGLGNLVYSQVCGELCPYMHPTDAIPNGTGNSTCNSASAGCTFVNSTMDDGVLGKTGVIHTDAQSLNAITIPLPIATFQMGDAANPSVFEIRSPSHPTTTTSLTVEPVAADGTAGAAIDSLFPTHKVEGDIFGAPTGKLGLTPTGVVDDCSQVAGECHVDYTVNPNPAALRFTQHVLPFNGTFPDGTTLPGDGLYQVNITAFDANGVRETDTQPFLYDSTPPATLVTTGNGYVGAALLAGGSAIPVTWAAQESGSGLKQVGLWEHTGADGLGDASHWHFIATFPNGINEFDDAGDRLSTIDDYYYVTIGEDMAGNIEAQDVVSHMLACGDALRHLSTRDASGCGDMDWTIYGAIKNGTAPNGVPPKLYAAFLVKQGQGAWQKLIVDAQRPQSFGVPSVTGSSVSRASLSAGVNALYVRAGGQFEVSICGADANVGVSQVLIVFDYVDPATGNVTSWSSPPATDAGPCASGGEKYVYAGWGGVNANKTLFPDGIWAVSADIYDRAGNRDQVSIATVILDSKAPTVNLQAPLYPSGQQAIKPGDTLTLRLAATDEFGVDTSAIRVDASNLNQTGVLPTHATRVNGVVYQEVSFKVDKVKRDDLYLLPVTVPDQAGNVWYGNFSVIVDTSRFDMVRGSVGPTGVSYHSVNVSWSTTTNTTSMVRYGTSPLELKSRTPVDATLVKDHHVTIEGLDASTRYYFRVVSDTAGGYENESDVFDAITGTALFLAPESPAVGARVHGDVPVLFTGGLHDSTDPVAFTLEARGSATDPWSFVTTLTESGTEHQLSFNSSRYLDGDGYQLRVTAVAGKDNLSTTIGPFETDNTPPELDVLSPLVATNDSQPTILAVANDNLAGFASTGAVALSIDGRDVSDISMDVSNLTGRIAYPLSSPLTQGPHTLSLRVTDRAGNVATQTWTLIVDSVPPSLTVNAVKYSPGPSAAKLGGSVTINVTATDSSGVGSVTLDTSALSDAPLLRLDHVAGTSYWVGTFTVTSKELGTTVHAALTATDIAGNTRASSVDVTIDNVKPTVSSVRATNVAQITATLTADSTEPVLLVVTAHATGVPDVAASTTTLDAHPTLTLTGLYPSRTYSFTAKVLDAAGNEVDTDGTFQTALDLTPPTQVGALSVLDLQNGTLRLSWPAASDDVAVAYYKVYRSDANGTLRPIAQVRDTTFDDVGLPLETSFTYQVAAVDYGGNEGVASQALRASATAVPRLTVGVVAPTVGSTATVFRYVVTYSSPGGVAPTYVRVLLDGAAQDMKAVGNGTYIYETRLAPHTRDHPHTYSFEASDGRYTVKFPADGSSLRGPLVSADPSADTAANGVGFAQRVPMLGIVGTATALTLAAAAVVVLRRRGSK